MRTFAVLLSILIIAWLALRLRPAVRQRVFGIERGAAVRCLVVAQLCGLAALIKLTQQLKEGGYA
jgi:hypothetical protein